MIHGFELMDGFGKSGAIEQAHDGASINYRRATKCSPQHLVGRQISLVGIALFAYGQGGRCLFAGADFGLPGVDIW
jgi:hypothetical protein